MATVELVWESGNGYFSNGVTTRTSIATVGDLTSKYAPTDLIPNPPAGYGIPEDYVFGGWRNLPTYVPADGGEYTAYYNKVGHYEVTLIVDGSVYDTIPVTKGYSVTLPSGPSPSGKTFKGWYTSSSGGSKKTTFTPTSDTTLYAQFELDVCEVSFTYRDASGSWVTIGPYQHQYGSKIDKAPITPPSLLGYIHTGWSPSLPYTIDEERVLISATYDAVAVYLVTFYVNGTVVKSQEVNKGGSVTPPSKSEFEHLIPENAVFEGWSGSYTNVQSYSRVDAILTEYYTATFKDWNGTVLKTETVAKGQSATAPSDPSRTGYTFTGWSPSSFTITKDTTFTAQYSINTYTISWDLNGGKINGSNTWSSSTVSYGSTLSGFIPPDPTSYPAWAEGFKGWYTASSGGTEVTSSTRVYGGATYYAQYTIKTFTLTFIDGVTGDTIATEDVSYNTPGTSINYPDYRDHEADGWSFVKWEPSRTELGNITSDRTIRAVYEQIPFTVNFNFYLQNINDNKYSLAGRTSTSAVGGDGIQVRDHLPQYLEERVAGIELDTLSPTEIKVEYTGNDQFYDIYYNRKYFTITFNYKNKNGRNESSTDYVRYEGTAVPPSSENGNLDYLGYSFANWSSDEAGKYPVSSFNNVKSDKTYYAQYNTNSYPYYAVTCLETLTPGEYSEQIPQRIGFALYGNEVSYKLTPAQIEHFTYRAVDPAKLTISHFNGGDDNVFKLYYTRDKYQITWNLNGGLVNGSSNDITSSQPYEKPLKSFKPNDPTKIGQIFQHWKDENGQEVDLETATVSGKATYTAIYYPQSFKIFWNTNGGNFSDGNNQIERDIYYGNPILLPTEKPTKRGYTFKGWYTASSGGTRLTGDEKFESLENVTYYAQYEEAYSISWFLEKTDSTPYAVTHHEKNSRVGDLPDAPSKNNYNFKGWQKEDGSAVTIDTIVDKSFFAYAIWQSIAYTTKWDAHTNGGMVSGESYVEFEQPYNQPIIFPEDATHPTKSFSGWFTEATGGKQINKGDIYTTIGPSTYYAQFSGFETATYKVEHYLQNADDNNYILHRREEKTGNINSNPTAVPISITGAKENTTHPDRVATGTIDKEGTLVLKLYYDRVLYKIYFKNPDASTISTIDCRHGATPKPPENPTYTPKDNFEYKFHKWNPDITAATKEFTYNAIYIKSFVWTYAYGLNKQGVLGKNKESGTIEGTEGKRKEVFVSADEWNRLVSFVNEITEAGITEVAVSKAPISASVVNAVAVPLGIGEVVAKVTKITADFFNALKDAINEKSKKKTEEKYPKSEKEE